MTRLYKSALSLMLFVFSANASAFSFFIFSGGELRNSANGIPVIWLEQNVAFSVSVNEQPYQQDILSALVSWEETGANINLVEGIPGASSCANGDGVNAIGRAQSNCGRQWGDTLGITILTVLNSGQRAYISETDVLLPSYGNVATTGYNWALPGDPDLPSNRNCYINNLGGRTCDFTRVVLHELGHAIGLNHPDEVGQHVVAVMNSGGTSNDMPKRLSADDILGARELYAIGRTVVDGTAGLPPPPPPKPASPVNTDYGTGVFSLSLLGCLAMVCFMGLAKRAGFTRNKGSWSATISS